MIRVEGLDHVGLAVRDVRKSAEWYQHLLGLKRLYEEAWRDYPAVVGIGDTSIAFFPSDSDEEPVPIGLPLRHIAFRVDRKSFVAAQETLKREGIAFEFQDHKIVHSLYFSDPDGYLIELTTYDVPAN